MKLKVGAEVGQPNKKRFEVSPEETIAACLERMEREGYSPVRRLEEPVFREIIQEGKSNVEPCGRKIVFEGKLKS